MLLNVSSWAIGDTVDLCNTHGSAPADGLTKPVVQFTRKTNALPFSGRIFVSPGGIALCSRDQKFPFSCFSMSPTLWKGELMGGNWVVFIDRLECQITFFFVPCMRRCSSLCWIHSKSSKGGCSTLPDGQ